MTDQEINEALARELGWTYDEKFQDWADPEGVLNPLPDFCQGINEAIARELGYEDCGDGNWARGGKDYDAGPLKDYCRDIGAAWEVVENLKDNIVIDRWERKVEHEQKDWRVLIRVTPYGPQIESFADTAPMAICLAFLKSRSLWPKT